MNEILTCVVLPVHAVQSLVRVFEAYCGVYVQDVAIRAGFGLWIFFFFQAEDGIRDDLVTGVQTCALPISDARSVSNRHQQGMGYSGDDEGRAALRAAATGKSARDHWRRLVSGVRRVELHQWLDYPRGRRHTLTDSGTCQLSRSPQVSGRQAISKLPASERQCR